MADIAVSSSTESIQISSEIDSKINNGMETESITEKINKCKEKLESAQQENPINYSLILSTLIELKDLTPVISQSLLQSTQIGIAVNKLAKSDNIQVKTEAKNIVGQWKALVLPSTSTTTTPQVNKRKADELETKSTNHNRSNSNNNNEIKQPESAKKQKEPSAIRTESNLSSSSNTNSNINSINNNNNNNNSNNPSSPNTPSNLSRSISGASTTSSSNNTAANSTIIPANSGMGLLKDPLRNKIQLLLFQAIGGELSVHEAKLAVELEQAIFTLYNDTDNRYKTKYRELAMNLKDPQNPQLNFRLLSGEWSCEEIVRKSVSELASEQLKLERAKEADWHKQELRSDLDKTRGMTDMFRCGKCKERKCTYYQKQTRSADEPMTTFVYW